MPNKKNPTRRKSRKRKRPLLKSMPRWAVVIGMILIVSLYVWAFYYFFVSPTGFRWRGLYGDAKYPNGYEIQGIDISHYQAISIGKSYVMR